LDGSGAYIVVTGSSIVGVSPDGKSKINTRVNGIRAGINPDLLSSNRIYDANKLSDWASTHPNIALWVNATLQEVDLAGLQAYGQWSTDNDISQTAFQVTDEPRFIL
jgi:hypothetical protein